MEKYNIIAKILSGGKRYDTTEYHIDTDYLVIVKDDIEFERIFDNASSIDYLCYGEKFLHQLLNGEKEHYNLPYVLLDVANQNNYLINYNIFEESRKNYILKVYKKWLTEKNNNIIKNLKSSKRIFYAFVFMFYIKNNACVLTQEQQQIVNNVHQRLPFDEKYIIDFVKFYSLDSNYLSELKSLNRLYSRPNIVKRNEHIAKAKQELKEIKSWFSSNDWKVNKIVIGEWSQDDPRWQEYLNERAIKRARQDELIAILGKGE